MKNTVRFNTSFEDEEEGRTISGNSNTSSSDSSSQQLIQGQIFVLHGFDKYQKQVVENEISHQGGIVSPMISDQVISTYTFIKFSFYKNMFILEKNFFFQPTDELSRNNNRIFYNKL